MVLGASDCLLGTLKLFPEKGMIETKQVLSDIVEPCLKAALELDASVRRTCTDYTNLDWIFLLLATKR